MVSPPRPTPSLPWYRHVTRYHWDVFIGSFFGRLLDGYETYALFLILTPALQELLAPAQQSSLSEYAGIVMGATLLGRAVGGVLAGVAADYVGRRLALMGTILTYAVCTGLTGLAQNWMQLAVFRFLTGASLGGDLAIAATMIAESWPPEARAKGQSLMQSAFAWGSLLAAAVWVPLGHWTSLQSWRLLFFGGVIPAFWVVYLRSRFRESEWWLKRHAERKRLRQQRKAGVLLSSAQAVVANFSLVSLFADPTLRRRTFFCMVLSLATTMGMWAVSSWIPAYVESALRAAGVANPETWAGMSGLLFTAGAVAGYLAAAFLADVLGRRVLLAGFFCGSFLTTVLLFRVADSPLEMMVAAAFSGTFTLGQFSWIAIYPPELFPTAVRATAVSVVFNTGRLISVLGPTLSGVLIARTGSYSTTAVLFALIYILALGALPFLPETKGQPLPE